VVVAKKKRKSTDKREEGETCIYIIFALYQYRTSAASSCVITTKSREDSNQELSLYLSCREVKAQEEVFDGEKREREKRERREEKRLLEVKRELYQHSIHTPFFHLQASRQQRHCMFFTCLSLSRRRMFVCLSICFEGEGGNIPASVQTSIERDSKRTHHRRYVCSQSVEPRVLSLVPPLSLSSSLFRMDRSDKALSRSSIPTASDTMVIMISQERRVTREE